MSLHSRIERKRWKKKFPKKIELRSQIRIVIKMMIRQVRQILCIRSQNKNMNFRRIIFSAVFFTSCIFSFAGTSGTQKNTSDDTVTTAHDAAVAAAKKDSALDSVEYLKKIIPSLSVPSEKRAAYAFLGSVQEQLGLY